ncbi:hypothetical protein GCM10009837_03980 [Streptomyces durmitorensis]
MALAGRDFCDDSAVYVDDDLWALIAPLLRPLSSEPSALRLGQAGKVNLITVYAVTSLAAEQTPPARLAQLARGHWRVDTPHRPAHRSRNPIPRIGFRLSC